MKHPTRLKNIQQEQALFRRRLLFAALVVFVCLTGLVCRYGYLQIMQYEQYQEAAEKNRIRLQAVPPTRGYIYDRNGILLADNHPVFTALVSQEDFARVEPKLPQLIEVFDLTEDDIEKFLGRIKRARSSDDVALKIDLNESQIARFSERRAEFAGVTIDTKMTRYYPHRDLFAHVIGYVGRINAKEAENLDKVAYAGTDLIGKIGIEKQYENLLLGVPGYQYIETNAHGKVLQQLGRTDSQRGNDLYLSIDYGLQKIAHDQLSGRRGSIVAIDPRTGEVLAFVSNPSFDPNPFVAGISHKAYNALRDDPDQPLYNRALQGTYPPGSTIKPFAGLGGIHYGLVDWNSRIYDPGYFTLPGDSHRFRDWRKGGHGVVDMNKAIAQSVDTYFYVLSYRMGIEKMHAWMSHFGFGQKTGIDLPHENSGIYPSPEWKMRTRKAKWLPGETISVSIGQGYFTATTLQVAMATAITANKGWHITPHLLHKSEGDTPYTISHRPDYKLPYNGADEDWDKMRDAMKMVIHSPNGTARRVGLTVRGYEIAGKTGTAQVKSIAQGKRYNKHAIDQRHWDHAWFNGFAPADNPRVAVAVLVENGQSGSGTAAPIAKALFDYVVHRMDTDPIVPDPETMRHPSLMAAAITATTADTTATSTTAPPTAALATPASNTTTGVSE
ncbi:MAG: penicillin-binding protein 2 [Pseudomonadota bacterium]|nr:penicillin-binding protein 2 [Pseudomonadota bacterium]